MKFSRLVDTPDGRCSFYVSYTFNQYFMAFMMKYYASIISRCSRTESEDGLTYQMYLKEEDIEEVCAYCNNYVL